MTRRMFGVGLFLLVVLVVPLPMFGLEGANVPVGRFVQLACALTVLAVIEGTGGMVGLFLMLFWGHVLVYGLLWAAAAALVARLAGAAWSPRARMAALLAAAVGLVAWGLYGASYDTPFHHRDAHASLGGLYR